MAQIEKNRLIERLQEAIDGHRRCWSCQGSIEIAPLLHHALVNIEQLQLEVDKYYTECERLANARNQAMFDAEERDALIHRAEAAEAQLAALAYQRRVSLHQPETRGHDTKAMKEFDAIVDKVLGYRPKARSKPAVQRKRRKTILDKRRTAKGGK